MKVISPKCLGNASPLSRGFAALVMGCLLTLTLTTAFVSPASADSTQVNTDRSNIANDQNQLNSAQQQLQNDQQQLNNLQQQYTVDQNTSGVSADTLNADQGAIAAAQGNVAADQSGIAGFTTSLSGADSSLDADEGVLATSGGMTLGDVICNVYDNISEFAELYDLIAYTVGAFFIAYSIYGFAKHMESPGQNPIHTQIIRMSAGAFMTILPSIVGTLVDTMFVGNNGTGALYCAATGTITGGAVTLDVMLENAVNDISGPFFSLMSMLAFIIGIYYILHGLILASKYGYDARSTPQSKIVGCFLGGALMVALSDTIGVVMGSIFGTSAISASPLSWTMVNNLTTDAGAQASIQGALTACLTVVQMVGIIAVIRGIMILKRASEGSGQVKMAQGITHLIGGVLALNIYQFITIMGQTFGTDFF